MSQAESRLPTATALESSSGARLFAPAVFIGIWLAALAMQFSVHVNHDVAWTIYQARMILQGAELYVDVVDINPPLICYLFVLPVALAEALGLSDLLVSRVFVFALAALSLGLTGQVLSLLLGRGAPRIWHVVMVACAAALLLLPGYDFGQREHLLVMLGLPYVLHAALRARGQATHPLLGFTIGCVGALGFALKPYFLLLPAALELFVMLRTGSWKSWVRPDSLTMAGVVALYLVSLPLFTPEYLTTILPYALETNRGMWNPPVSVAAAVIEVILLPLLALAVLAANARRADPDLLWVLAIAAGSVLVALAAQMKGWSYHIYPLLAVLFLTAAYLLALGLRPGASGASGGPVQGKAAIKAALASVLLLFPLIDVAGWYRTARPEQGAYGQVISEFVAAAERHASGSSLYAFSTSPRPLLSVVVHSGVDWASRACCVWLLPGVLQARDGIVGPERRQILDEIESVQVGTVVEDLEKHRPALVFVEAGAWHLGFKDRDFDYLDYFGRNPRFAAFWADYEEISGIANFRVFRRRTVE